MKLDGADGERLVDRLEQAGSWEITDECRNAIEDLIKKANRTHSEAPADREDYEKAHRSVARLRKLSADWVTEVQTLKAITSPDLGDEDRNIGHIYRLIEITMPDLGVAPLDHLCGLLVRLEEHLGWLETGLRPRRGPPRNLARRYFIWGLADVFERETGRRATAAWDSVSEAPCGDFARVLAELLPYLSQDWIDTSTQGLIKEAARCLAERRRQLDR